MAPAADGMQLLLQRWVIIDVEPARTCPFFFLENIYLYFILYLCVCECVCVWGVGGWKYIPTCCTKEFSVMSAAFSHEIIGRDVRCVAKKKKERKRNDRPFRVFFLFFYCFIHQTRARLKVSMNIIFFFYLTTKWHSEVEVEQIIFAIITWDSVMKFSIDGWIMFFFILWRIDRSENKNIECTAHVSDQLKKKQTAKPKKSTPIQQSNSIKRHQNRLPADRIYWLSDEIERCVGLQPIDSSQCGCAGLKKDRRRNLQFLILRSSIEIITGVSISTKPFNLLWSMFWNICFQFPFNDIIQWWLMCQCKKELRDRKLIGWKKKTSLKLS